MTLPLVEAAYGMVAEADREDFRAAMAAYRRGRLARRSDHVGALDAAADVLQARRPGLQRQPALTIAIGWINVAVQLAGQWVYGGAVSRPGDPIPE